LEFLLALHHHFQNFHLCLILIILNLAQKYAVVKSVLDTEECKALPEVDLNAKHGIKIHHIKEDGTRSIKRPTSLKTGQILG